MTNNKNRPQSSQAGLVSFMVVTVLMLVLTLIVMSYARIVQREQVQTLDRQLNAQAEYAAESGINDAINTLKVRPAVAESTYNKCSGSGSFIDAAMAAGASLNSDLGNGVSYSCLLVNPTPSELRFDAVGRDKSTVTPIRAEGGASITSLTIEWGESGASLSSCPVAGSFPSDWPSTDCKLGILRLELVPFAGPTPATNLLTDRGIIFAQPNKVSNQPAVVDLSTVAGNSQGQPVLANCNAGKCSVTITGIGADLTGYLRMRSIYLDNKNVEIKANGGSVNLTGSQVVIDATGRAGGVLKRLKVHAQIPINKGITAGEYALQSKETQCKKFSVTNSSLNVAGSLPPECGIN